MSDLLGFLSDSLMRRLCNLGRCRLDLCWRVNSESWQIRQSFELIRAQTEKIRPADRNRWGEMSSQKPSSAEQRPLHVLHMRICRCLTERETCYLQRKWAKCSVSCSNVLVFEHILCGEMNGSIIVASISFVLTYSCILLIATAEDCCIHW